MASRATITRKAVGSTSNRSSRTVGNSIVPESDDISLQYLARASPELELPLYNPYERHCDEQDRGHDDDDELELLRGATTVSSTRPVSGYASLTGHSELAGWSRDQPDTPPPGPTPQQPGPSHGFFFHVKAWWQELGCCLLALGLFGGLVGLLLIYDGKPPPRHLTTMVATIATICRALTVIPISEGLSQLKCNSFSRAARPLTDLYALTKLVADRLAPYNYYSSHVGGK